MVRLSTEVMRERKKKKSIEEFVKLSKDVSDLVFANGSLKRALDRSMKENGVLRAEVEQLSEIRLRGECVNEALKKRVSMANRKIGNLVGRNDGLRSNISSILRDNLILENHLKVSRGRNKQDDFKYWELKKRIKDAMEDAPQANNRDNGVNFWTDDQGNIVRENPDKSDADKLYGPAGSIG
jgi:regulator of replication initiation timing